MDKTRPQRFMEMMGNPLEREKFHEFLETKHSDENYLFVIAAEAFQKAFKDKEDHNASTLKENALRIFDDFFREDSKYLVSLSDEEKESVQRAFQNGNFVPTMFDEAKDSVLQALFFDMYFAFENHINSLAASRKHSSDFSEGDKTDRRLGRQSPKGKRSTESSSSSSHSGVFGRLRHRWLSRKKKQPVRGVQNSSSHDDMDISE